MSWCLVIPAVLVTLLAIAALVAPSQAFWSLITGLLRGCIATVLLIAAMLLTGLVLLIQGMLS